MIERNYAIGCYDLTPEGRALTGYLAEYPDQTKVRAFTLAEAEQEVRSRNAMPKCSDEQRVYAVVAHPDCP